MCLNKKGVVKVRKILLICLIVIAIAINGCGKNEKRNITSPDLAIDNASATQELASNILDSVVGGFTSGGSSGSSPALSPSLGPIGDILKSYYSGPDAGGYYTLESSIFKYHHPFWDWATTLTVKIKEVDAAGVDIIGAWLVGETKYRKHRTQPITVSRIIEAENDKRKVKDEITHINDYTPTTAEYPGLGVVDGTTWRVTPANGVTVKVTHTNLKTNVVGNLTIQSIDAYIADGRWLHQLIADYSDTTSRKSHFDLTRNNDKASAYFGYHTGDGNIYFKDELIAKVHLNGDGTGYYTLASENFATQHAFNNEMEKRRKIAR